MKRLLILVLALSSAAFAQEASNTVVYKSQGMGSISAQSATVQGAPYSATVTNESVQTLADGNRIVQTSTGTTAREAQGRSRQDTALPAIGNLSAANAPHLVFIQDPVAQVSYTLDLTNKAAQKMATMPPPAAADPSGANVVAREKYFVQMGTAGTASTGGTIG